MAPPSGAHSSQSGPPRGSPNAGWPRRKGNEKIHDTNQDWFFFIVEKKNPRNIHFEKKKKNSSFFFF
jgi:hypothetical protein